MNKQEYENRELKKELKLKDEIIGNTKIALQIEELENVDIIMMYMIMVTILLVIIGFLSMGWIFVAIVS